MTGQALLFLAIFLVSLWLIAIFERGVLMNNKPTLTEAYQQGRDDEYEHTKIQIEIVDKLYGVIHDLLDELEDDVKSSQVFGNGLMNSYVVLGRVEEASKAVTNIALDALVAEAEVLGLYDE